MKAPAGILKALVLAAAVFCFAACRLIPEIEGEYPTADLDGYPNPSYTPKPGKDEGKLFGDARDSRASTADAGGPAEAAGGEGEVPEEVLADLPPEEPGDGAETQDSFLPEPEFEFAQADFEETPAQEPEAPVQLPAPAQQTPPAQVSQPPQPPPQQQAQVQPPARMPQQQPSRPPEAPAFLQPSEPVEQVSEPLPAPSIIPDLPLKIPETAGEDIQYSRTVRALTGQYVEIPFRGPGWVYLGELGSRRGMYYDSRRVEDEGMIFVFRADEAGTYSLKFNRQDFIRDIILNDHVQVLVEDPPRITGNAWTSAETPGDRVYAGPRWPPAVPAAPAAASGSVPAEAASSETGAAPPPESAVSAAPSVPSGASPEPASASPSGGEPALPGGVPEDLLGRARAEYEAGRTAGALTALNQFKERFPGGSDEAWWLYGQVLEANSPERDIRLALEYYRRLVREYPQSARYDDAAKRIAYLERFYFTIQ